MTKTEIGSSPNNPAHALAAINVVPGMQPSMLEVVAIEASDALVLIGDMGGGIPTDLHPSIQKITEAGTPVFIVREAAESGSLWNAYGKVHQTDKPLLGAIRHGAVHLDKANQETIPVIMKSIQAALDENIRGRELAETIRVHFSFEPELAETIRVHFSFEPDEQRPPSVKEKMQNPANWKEYDERLREAGVGGLPDGMLARTLNELDSKS